jgi:hypothetical protein
MPQNIAWQALDGDWSFALVWFAVTYARPEAYLLLKSPSGQRWCFRCVASGADAPFALLGGPSVLHEGRHLTRSSAVERASAARGASSSGYSRLRRVVASPPSDNASAQASASSNAVPNPKATPSQPAAKVVAKARVRRESHVLRYYAVRDVSASARVASVLRPGVYCCVWRDFLLLLPGCTYFGCGIHLKGFDDLISAVLYLVPRTFVSVDVVPVTDRDRVATLVRDSASSP